MRTTSVMFVAVAMLTPRPAVAQTPADSAAIRATVLDYVEGWYAGNGDRMGRALHPELVKRIVRQDDSTGQTFVQTMGATALVNATRRGGGRQTPPERQEKAVQILDVFQRVASAKAVMSDWIDYLQLAKVDGRWVIINVLWELKQRPH